VTVGVGVDLVATRPAALPVVVAVYGSGGVGMGATLNPLGTAGVGLPVAVTAPGGGRHLVAGYALSAAVPGVVVLSATTALSALAVGLPGVVVVGVGAFAGVLVAASAAVSLAVGVVLPNLDGLRPTGAGIRPPRLLASSVFLAAVAVLGTPALVGVGWAPVLAGSGSPVAVAVAGLLLGTVLAAAVGGATYRWSVRRVAGYRE
jgi:hypothetical protein